MKHYQRWIRRGSPLAKVRTDPEFGSLKALDLLLASSAREGGTDCSPWPGLKDERGYGRARRINGTTLVHRIAWEKVNGPIPEGMLVDHICHNKSCFKISHLRLATNKQNQENRKGARSDSSSGVRGAIWDSKRGNWYARVSHNGKRYYGGHFDTPEEAGAAASAIRSSLFTHSSS